jgi:hypothetical protein
MRQTQLLHRSVVPRPEFLRCSQCTVCEQNIDLWLRLLQGMGILSTMLMSINKGQKGMEFSLYSSCKQLLLLCEKFIETTW